MVSGVAAMMAKPVHIKMTEVDEILENEWYLVRHSGEIPEIAYNASIYHLTRAKEGPHLTLTAKQQATLLEAAIERFYEIIVRDLDHANHNTSIYRGIERSIANYERFLTFCARQQRDPELVRGRVTLMFVSFLDTEYRLVQAGQPTIINCTSPRLLDFAHLLGVESEKGAELAALACCKSCK